MAGIVIIAPGHDRQKTVRFFGRDQAAKQLERERVRFNLRVNALVRTVGARFIVEPAAVSGYGRPRAVSRG